MNKKFSTLIAAFLAAGSFVSVEAGVVKVTTPVNGKSYVIAEDATVTDGAFTALTYALNANADKDGVATGEIAKNATSLTDFTKWVFGTTTADEYRISLEASKYYLAASSATEMTIKEAKEGTDVAKDTWKFAANKLGAAFAGTTTPACTDQILFAARGGALSLNTTGSDIAFYAENYNDGDKETLGGMEFVLKNSVAANEFVFIKIGDKFVSINEDGATVEMVAADALKTTLGKYRATFKVDASGKQYSAIAAANQTNSFLKAGAAGDIMVLDATANATAFFFDNSDAYIGQKGASMYTATGTANYINVDGKTTAIGTTTPADRPDAKIYKSSNILVAKAGAGLGMPRSLVLAEDFVNGGSYYLSADAANFITTNDKGVLTATPTPTPGANAVWKVAQSKVGKGYDYTFYNEANGVYLKALAGADGFTSYTSVVEGQGYTGGFVLTNEKGALTQSTTTVSMTSVDVAYANQIIGLYRTDNAPYTATELKAFQDGSFSMAIALNKETTGKTIKGADLFGGDLVPEATGTTTRFRLMDGTGTDAKYIVLDKNAKWGTANGLNGDDNKGLKFAKVSESALDAGKQHSYFQISYPLANGKAGNQEFVVEVYNTATGGSSEGRLFITIVDNIYYLTVAKKLEAGESWAYVKNAKKDDPTLVDLKTLLKGQFVKINYVKPAEVTPANKYKVDGILSVRDEQGSWWANEADYVAATSVVANAPEAQWALTYDGTVLTLTNREYPQQSLTIAQLYKTDKAGVYRVKSDDERSNIDGDLITITFVENHKKTDGYMVEAENILRNTAYYLGQSRKSADGDINAYWAENHGTHQIGATVDKQEATKWSLGLIKKSSWVNGGKNETEIDSVLVVSEMHIWDEAKKALTKELDTLVILPYSFQNRENREFVRLNDDEKLRYYICDERNKIEPRSAQRFGLKIKPNGTYNYVALTYNGYVENGYVAKSDVAFDSKVYQANSVDKGTWANMTAYAGDANALMVVDPDKDPEYRKIAVEWGDTISLYRQENSAQKVYEKRDDKSVVAKDTLSFLNISNDFQFTINPAIFADTAYINRGTGVDANTCYQYLLVVEPKFGYHNDGCGVPGHPQEKAAIDTVYGRFLVNLIDTANIYGKTHLHNNPYINKIEADENLAKLSFVDGYHTGDKLYIPRQNNTDTLVLDMNSPEFNVAKFAFRYVDHKTGTFKIQTQFKYYDPSVEADKVGTHQDGYLRWVNGTLVVTNGFTNGDVFNMNENETGNPTNNEGIEATELSVIAGSGFVTINNAAGKTVSISNILGQTIAKAVLTSDNATIAVPSGIVVVSVEGEAAVKAIVK